MPLPKEPTFRLEIKACNFAHLSLEDLTAKLQLVHKLNLKPFYTIVEDTNDGKLPPDIVSKP